MKSIADQLPSEIVQQIHLDGRKNEAAYWADSLISTEVSGSALPMAVWSHRALVP